MKYAIIDIGSSIIKYKIYEYQNNIIEPIIINDETVGLINYRQNNKLNEKGLKILLDTLKKFKNYSLKLNVKNNYYFATASLRNLKNSAEILNIVKKELNINISIISGKEEADFSFNSINMINIPKNEGVLIDIGGGSSEITIFKNSTVEAQESIPTGVLKIYNNFISSIYPNKKEQDIILKDTLNKIHEFKIEKYEKEYLYGLGKTFTTIKKLLEHMNIKNNTSNVIDIEHVDFILNKFTTNTKENYKPLLQVDSERIHTVIPSLLITKAVSIEFGIKKIYVCNTTLQDGIIYNLLKNSFD